MHNNLWKYCVPVNQEFSIFVISQLYAACKMFLFDKSVPSGRILTPEKYFPRSHDKFGKAQDLYIWDVFYIASLLMELVTEAYGLLLYKNNTVN